MTHPHLARRPPSEGNRSTFTWAAWMSRSEYSQWQRIFTVCESPGDNLTTNASVQFAGDSYNNTLRFFDTMNHSDSHNTDDTNVYSRHRLKDCGGWYHLMVVIDTTAPNADDRNKIFINGLKVKDFANS